MHAKYEFIISNGSKVIANVKVGHKPTNQQTYKPTNRQGKNNMPPPDHRSGGHKNGTISKIMKISKFLLYCLFPITQWSFCIFSLNSDQWFERRCHLMCPSECFGIKLQKCHNFQSIGKTKLPFCMVCSPSSKDASVKVSLNSVRQYIL